MQLSRDLALLCQTKHRSKVFGISRVPDKFLFGSVPPGWSAHARGQQQWGAHVPRGRPPSERRGTPSEEQLTGPSKAAFELRHIALTASLSRSQSCTRLQWILANRQCIVCGDGTRYPMKSIFPHASPIHAHPNFTQRTD